MSAARPSASGAAYRWQVFSRVLAAGLGGYAAASAATALLALLWPLPPAHAVLASTMLAFVWYAAAVIWVFSVRSAARAWLGMAGASLALGAMCVLAMGGA
ncbi:DUF3649 domain-containing protein [Orrella sp. JC864]|uniref:DUF3649 domain-containing protein n=1 Tax=Orrella sp. JC864 TaxID=3120298 RepID=UPI003008BD22